MAFKSKATPTRISIPHEPGEWVEITQPSAGDLRDIAHLVDYDYILGLINCMVVGWSYEGVPVSPESIADLDAETYGWLASIVPEHTGLRPEEEKKDSDSSSKDGREPVTAASRKSSAT